MKSADDTFPSPAGGIGKDVVVEPEVLATQRRLVEALRDPACYPHGVRRIEVIETHISFVILTGDYAYKIKKAVDLGFVDYATPARRLYCCQEELRLNRRLAAPLYLDVVAIGGTPGQPRIMPLADAAADRPAVEHAVRMREFDQADLLDRVLARGELGVADLTRLADVIAGFHRRVPAAGVHDGFGTAATIAATMLDNFAVLRRLADPADAAGAAQLAAIEDWSRRRHGELADRFAARLAAGRVRECHGDLHLGNMIRLADGLHVFDGIEFNPQLRWIDVVSEIAFLVMDLSERGRPDYAWRFLDAWLADSGDYDGLAVLPFYLVYRALVRAKVGRIRAAQAGIGAAQRAAALASAGAYLDYAGRVIARPLPALILMHGLSGSGKSHVARQLGETFGAIRIRSDVERKRLHGLAALADSASPPGGGLYAAEATAATYARLAELVRSISAAGFSTIVDASFLERVRRDAFRQLARELQLPCVIIHCAAPVDVLEARIVRRRQRAGDPSEADAGVLARQRRTADALAADEAAQCLEAGSDAERSALIAAVGRLLDRSRD